MQQPIATVIPDTPLSPLPSGAAAAAIAAKKPKKSLGGIFGFIKCLLMFGTGGFLEFDDVAREGVLERQKEEQVNIALVSALLMTISYAFIPMGQDWDNDWIKGLFGLSVSCCNCLLVCSVSLSVASLLVLNGCSNDGEALELTKRAGKFLLVPFRCFIASLFFFGFCATLLMYAEIYNFGDPNYFYLIVGITYPPAMIVLPITAAGLVRTLYRVKHDKKDFEPTHLGARMIVLSEEECEVVFRRYLKEYYSDNVEMIPDNGCAFDEFKDYAIHAISIDRGFVDGIATMALRTSSRLERVFNRNVEVSE